MEPKATSFRPLPTECNVLFDLVVEIAHVLSSMAHPVLVKALGTFRIVPQVRVSKAAEHMVSSFVRSGERINVAQFLKGLVQMAADDV